MQSSFLKVNDNIQIPQLAQIENVSDANYRIIELHGGGMGTCAKISGVSGKKYALKTIHTQLLKEKNTSKRYLEELKTWITLSSCNGISKALTTIRINDIPCVVSDWMKNGNLRSKITQKDKIFFYTTFDRIIKTLEWTYNNHNVIHRDLKPENILLNGLNQALICDWGLSKRLDDQYDKINNLLKSENNESNINLTQDGMFMGSILYASPEQLLGDKHIDFRTDIYAIGCMMYEFETGEAPFTGHTINQIFKQHMNVQPKKLGGLFKSTNYGVEKIIDKCLKKNKDRRYKNYKELSKDFLKIANRTKGFQPFSIKSQYLMPQIGKDELGANFKAKKLDGLYGDKAAIFSSSEIEPYLKEAETLMSIGNHEKAIKIFQRFFVIPLFMKNPDVGHVQYITINLAICLKSLGRTNEALNVISVLDRANDTPAEYYVNKVDILNISKRYKEAEELGKKGDNKFPNDGDLLGNLTISLLRQEKLEEASSYSAKRIKIQKTIFSLEEAALIEYHRAEKIKNTEFKTAIKFYNSSLDLLNQSLNINPNFETGKLNKANVYFKLKKYNESIEIANQIYAGSKSASNAMIAAFYISRNLLWTSNFTKAVEFCTTSLKHFKNSILIRRVKAQSICDGYSYGKCFTKQDVLSNECVGFFEEIVHNTDMRLPNDFNFLADIYQMWGGDEEVGKAFNTLNTGKKYFPKYWKFDHIIAGIYLRYNYHKEALPFAIEAKKKAPWREAVRGNLVSIYKGLGNLELAAKEEALHSEIKKVKKNLYNKK